jgi:hypothetical protein
MILAVSEVNKKPTPFFRVEHNYLSKTSKSTSLSVALGMVIFSFCASVGAI